MSEPLFEAAAMEIFDGPNAVVRAVGRGSELEGVGFLHVRDGEGREIATVRRFDDRGGFGKALGAVLGAAGVGSRVTKHVVAGAGGAELMRLEISGEVVVVRDPGGAPAALLSNDSTPGGKVVDINLYGPPSGRRYGFRRPGPPLLTIHEPQPIAPFDWAVEADGRTVARAANADDGRNVVTVTGSLDEPRRRLLVAFACSLVERRWTEIPPAPTGGGG